jgi:allophanate hydrolase
MNLFDLCGVAVPAGFRSDGMPFGVTLVGPRASDHALLDIAGRLQSTWVSTVGALGVTLPPRDAASPAALPPRDAASPTVRPPPDAAPPATVPRDGEVLMAVCGAHMQGLPLNHQLRDRGGYLVQATHTSARYRLFALPGGPPHRPGMIRVNDGGAAIELEVWALPADQAGSFVAGIPAPLGVGKVELASGALVTGFLCEGYAADGAADITGFGGWRAYVKSLSG